MMRNGRYAPFVLAGLFVLRVAACGSGKQQSTGAAGATGAQAGASASGGRGGTTADGGRGGTASEGGRGGSSGSPDGSTGGAPVPSGACVNGSIVYGNNETHTCTYQDCWIDAATGSASCMRPSVANEVPFRTCRVAADCGGATYCEVFGQQSEMLLGGATCMNGVCDWMTKSSQSCSSLQYCYPSGCQVWNPTTSGGFPWNPSGPTGAGGSTSGGFPWGSGGATGTDAATAEDATSSGDATGE
jgi:hypothetical protein